MKKNIKDFNPYFFKIINLNKKINFIFLNYKKIKLSNSLSYEDIFLLYFFYSKKIFIDNFLLNTGKLFLETINLIKKIKIKYNINFNIYNINEILINKYIKKYTLNAFYNNIILRKLCCYIRKVNPLNNILKKCDIWLTGQRKDHSFLRSKIYEYEYDKSRNLIKCNLLLNWDFKDIFYFIEKFDILNNILYNKGFLSIGCDSCTKLLNYNENNRDGRWWWELKNKSKECGLHN